MAIRVPNKKSIVVILSDDVSLIETLDKSERSGATKNLKGML